MAYWVEKEDAHVLEYLSGRPGMSENDVKRLVDFLDHELAFNGDFHRAHCSRLAPESYAFQLDLVFLDDSGKVRVFSFIASDANVEMGVLRVLYCWEQE